MQLKTIFNRVTEYKPFVVEHVEMVERDSQPTIEITMRARENGEPICSGCVTRCPGYDTQPKARRFDFVPLWMIPVVLVYTMRRVQCPKCGVKVERVQWKRGHKYQTLVYQIDEGQKRLLWQGPDRTAKTLLRFFRFPGTVRSTKYVQQK